MTAELFAPGVVSTGHSERIAAFTPDGRELYFVLWGAPHSVVLRMKEVDGRWTRPRVAPFSGSYTGEFSISPDGNTIVFGVGKPVGGATEPDDFSWETWLVERSQAGWGEPRNLGSHLGGYATVSTVGNLYSMKDLEDGYGGDDIYVSTPVEGGYPEMENLGPPVNSKWDELDPFIAPDEAYLIFSRRDAEGIDLFISYRGHDGSWMEPVNMGDRVNSGAAEYCPTVSPDGRYLFFTSTRRSHRLYSETPITYEEKLEILNSPGNGSADIYWLDAGIIEDLKPEEAR